MSSERVLSWNLGVEKGALGKLPSWFRVLGVPCNSCKTLYKLPNL